MPDVIIDGQEVSVPRGTTVIQAAEQLGIFIPRYCYHPGLSTAGNCRICLVEVEKNPKLQVACNLPVTDGMVVHTRGEAAEDGRRAVLEFLLANHPLDCPVCDQSGECDLQNFYMKFGLYDPRFHEHKVKKKKAVQLGPHVMLDQERCILCSRCVRFTEEITETGELGIFNRGDRAELAIYPGGVLDNPYSTNVVDICPVGALTERESRFKVRVWYLSSAPTVCNGCSRGCNMDMHFVLDRPHLNDGRRVVRVKPRHNPDVNQWWLCDAGRYGLGWIDEGRLGEVRERGATSTWDAALAAIARAMQESDRSRVGVIASAQLTCEELFLIREIFDGARVSAAVPEEPGACDDFLVESDKNPNTQGARLLGMAGPVIGDTTGGLGGSADVPDGQAIAQAARSGELDVLWVFGHDLVELFGAESAHEIAQNVGLLVFSGTNENATVELAQWVVPTAAYLEKDGTFVNCEGRVQRIGRVFAPPAGVREDWSVLLELAERSGRPRDSHEPRTIFAALAAAEAAFAGLTYESIGTLGAPVAGSAARVMSKAEPTP
ncbi:MAG: molybdopterin-dependent oxidoreductase [bacterium]|nr:molybdopterin-dependent oxidoreductase [bacterium]